MSHQELKELAAQAVIASNQVKVAKRLSISPSALNQYLKDSYPTPHTIDERIREVYGQEFIDCPVLGDIAYGLCAEHRRRLPTTDSFYARMFRACQKCDHNGGKL